MIDGELRISASVNNHWLDSSDAILYGFAEGAGLGMWGFRGGEFRCGGVGTAGGMLLSMSRAKVREEEVGGRELDVASEGMSRAGGRYLSMVVMDGDRERRNGRESQNAANTSALVASGWGRGWSRW
jgi:hypothetical protein